MNDLTATFDSNKLKYCPRTDIIYGEEPMGCSELEFGLRKTD